RHTRFSRDWSSDVCSSDLKVLAHLVIRKHEVLTQTPTVRAQLQIDPGKDLRVTHHAVLKHRLGNRRALKPEHQRAPHRLDRHQALSTTTKPHRIHQPRPLERKLTPTRDDGRDRKSTRLN